MFLREIHAEYVRAMESAGELFPLLENLSELCVEKIENGGKIIWCGNGGSATDSSHLAAELVGRFRIERQAIASISLTSNQAIITALANDYSFEIIFERQIAALGNKNDILIALSTSGGSQNILRALNRAKEMQITTALFTSNQFKSEGPDYLFMSNSQQVEVIQAVHMMLGHTLCHLIEEKLYGNRQS
jgi:D-sedoheptulose 7-phosphate isomerase